MKIAFFSTKPYDKASFSAANEIYNHELVFFEPRLTPDTATLAQNFSAVCVFINDDVNETTLRAIAATGTRLVALRCAGFNNVDLKTAQELGIQVVRVPAYSPYAVAEHAMGLILMLNRKLYRAYNRVREDNFALNGLLGFDIHGKTVGVVGTGKIGQCFAQIIHGFGAQLVAYDVKENPEVLKLGTEYLDLPDLLSRSDIVSLHCPLIPATHHIINATSLQHLKPGAMLINTSRGGLVDTRAVIDALKTGQLGYFGADVYEQEKDLFFEDYSDRVIQDDTFQLLQSFSNVVVTAHQAFFTQEALDNIAKTTLSNVTDIAANKPCENALWRP
ncbi:2-hydroxyacid dehydrogenase [Oscillatoria sp. CS-180]|uniref:2-hydroxyacid dehydrogenase n=1 Tax=Oscillatoria sp. CS-180 TaxID=3021720 RepID=UPI0023308BE7|nr:2-hydroxyacid dehydrogenase [Oscillatoria sp. CS-180]MDB9529910.1 2-hydroxyacid dehydrogenase [Oscillatoria sp. CS-180]